MDSSSRLQRSIVYVHGFKRDIGPNAQIAGTNSYTENGLIAEYESDDEFDFEIVQDLLQSGRQKHAERSYAEAAAFFKSSIARAQKLSHTRRLSLELEDVQAKISSSNAEIDFDIVQRLCQEAQEAYVLELYSEAADMFRNGIIRTRRLSLDLRSRFELRDIQLKSAFSFLFLGELREAEWAFSDMVKQQIADDKGRVSNLLASSGLAQIYLCRENFEEAERWCRQSIVGWKRLFGKEHPLYLTSLKMMELIHETNGDSATAVVFTNLSCALNLQSAEQTKHSISPTLSASQTRNMVVSYHARRAKALLSELRLDRYSNDEALHSLCSLQAGQGTRHISNITATVRFLLEQGADSNAKPGCTTALMRGSAEGHRSIVQLLCERGADVKPKDYMGATALHLAARNGRTATVECLLTRGANLDQVVSDEKKHTALLEAALNGHDSTVRLLLRAGANTEAKDSQGWTALHQAAALGLDTVAKVLLSGGALIETRDEEGNTPLQLAVAKGKMGTAELLLAAGAETEAADIRGRTALMLSATNGSTASCKMLLDKGAHIEAHDCHGDRALHFAATRCGSTALVELLLEAGADVDAKTESGFTPLLWATHQGLLASTKLLLEAGANVNTRTKSGLTAAMQVMLSDHYKVCTCADPCGLLQLLVARGADLWMESEEGMTACDYALEKEDMPDKSTILEILMNSGGDQ